MRGVDIIARKPLAQKSWQLHGLRMEVSGLHHNVFGGFISLKLGIYCAGSGSVRLSDFKYRALPTPVA